MARLPRQPPLYSFKKTLEKFGGTFVKFVANFPETFLRSTLMGLEAYAGWFSRPMCMTAVSPKLTI
jgi:hypothetical protein